MVKNRQWERPDLEEKHWERLTPISVSLFLCFFFSFLELCLFIYHTIRGWWEVAGQQVPHPKTCDACHIFLKACCLCFPHSEENAVFPLPHTWPHDCLVSLWLTACHWCSGFQESNEPAFSANITCTCDVNKRVVLSAGQITDVSSKSR